eukprot:8009421-Alexandrium_andersonii.AAC.1
MTDASEFGGALIECDCSFDELRAEAAASVRGGWTIALPPSPARLSDASPGDDDSVLVYRLVRLFSGHRRDGDLAYWIEKLAEEENFFVE